MSLLHHDVRREAFAVASRFRYDFFDCLTVRGDTLFELTDALLCVDGPVTTPVDLTLTAEHRRGHDALNSGNVDVLRLRQALAGLPQPEAADGRLVLAVDVTHWLRPDAPTSPDRLFCHVYGRSGRSSDQFVPGWPYSFVAALESGRTSWCQILDALRLGPTDDVAEVTAAQVRRVVEDLIDMGRWQQGDRDILIVFDAGYDAPRMACLLEGLPVEVLGRMRTDRVMRKPVPVPLDLPATGRTPAQARQRVPLRQARHLGRARCRNRAGHRPLRHRPRDRLGPHPPAADHPLGVDRPHRRTPRHRGHVDPPGGRPSARRSRPAPRLAVVLGHRPVGRGRRSALAGVPFPAPPTTPPRPSPSGWPG